jgi:hypothetical protein
VYRPLSRPPRGAWARHLQAQRKARDLSQQQAFELVYQRAGWGPRSRASYVRIDEGLTQPSESVAQVLAAAFGWPEEDVVAEEEIDLIGVLNRQAAATERQAAAFDHLAKAIESQSSGLTTAVTGWGDLLVELLAGVRTQHATVGDAGAGGLPHPDRSGRGGRS